MTLYWSLKSYPELAALQPNERRIVSRNCWWCPFRHWQTWLAYFSQFVFIFGGIGLGMLLDGFPQIPEFPTFTLVFFGLGSFVALGIFTQVYSRMLRPHFRRYVDEHFRNIVGYQAAWSQQPPP